MKLIVKTPDNNIYNETVDSIIINDFIGSFQILKNHIPLIHVVEDGYIEIKNKGLKVYIYLIEAVIKFENNICLVLSQEAHVGNNYKEAKQIIFDIRKERKRVCLKNNIETSKLEKELKDNIKKTGAGSNL